MIPHWNRRDLLQALLTNIQIQTRPFDEVIVVDNGSTDDSPSVAEALGAKVVRLPSNLGFAPAVNRGIEAADADWVAILNNDVTLDPEWLAELVSNVSPEIDFASGKILSSRQLSTIDGTFDEISRGACAYRCGAGKPDSPLWNQPRRIRMAPMTAALFRRQLFADIGGLDETFESYLEDVDFGLRCAEHGRAGKYVPSAAAYHQGSATLGAWNPAAAFRISRNQVLLAAKHFRGQPIWPILAGQLLWALVALRHGCGWACVKGKFAGLRLIRSIPELNVSDHERKQFRGILEASEATIREVGGAERGESGLDPYWRAYFCISRR